MVEDRIGFGVCDVFHGKAWLGALVEKAMRQPFFGEPIVCVNAWNEWCEGAYLEPDLHFGSAYLNATARAVSHFVIQCRYGEGDLSSAGR